MTPRAVTTKAPPPTIQELMDLYLAEVRKTRSKRDVAEVDGSLDLLRSGLEGYGYQHLTGRELERWHAASEDLDLGHATFCRLFGARALAAYLDEFFGYFMIRKGDPVARGRPGHDRGCPGVRGLARTRAVPDR